MAKQTIKQLLYKLFFSGFCLRETCTRHRLTYQDGLIFTSEKDDGRFYTCTCRYSNCAQIVCRLNRGSTSPSRETEDENNVPYVPFPSVSTDSTWNKKLFENHLIVKIIIKVQVSIRLLVKKFEEVSLMNQLEHGSSRGTSLQKFANFYETHTFFLQITPNFIWKKTPGTRSRASWTFIQKLPYRWGYLPWPER